MFPSEGDSKIKKQLRRIYPCFVCMFLFGLKELVSPNMQATKSFTFPNGDLELSAYKPPTHFTFQPKVAVHSAPPLQNMLYG